jgi:endonuclease/exonuclease/phosphatase family metal-dependent hydrolase
MKRWFSIAVFALGCKGGDTDTSAGTTPSTTDTAAPTLLTVATYNAGLAPGYVPYTDERRDQTIDAIATLDADVVCLQEVWLQDDIDAIATAATAGAYAEVFYDFTEEDVTQEPACTEKEVQPIVDCAYANCAGSEDLTTCMLASCGAELGELSDGCFDCAAANIGLNDIDEIALACTTGNATLAWGGHNGLMLLSKLPLSGAALDLMPSWLVQRGFIHAEVGGVNVACTHLAADLSATTPYDGDDYASYEEEQFAQLDHVLGWLSDAGGVGALAGDLNTGPDGDGFTGELAANWQAVVASGFRDANLDSDAPFCTWCPADNELLDAGDAHAIDHVAVLGADSSDPVRLLDAPTALGDGTPVSYSDHFGLQVTITVDP